MSQVETKTDCCQTTQNIARRTTAPRYDVTESTEGFRVTAYVPGVEKNSVETTVDGDTLTVFARRTWTAPVDWTPVHREIPTTDYRLVLELDHRLNRDAITAELVDGVLTLNVPKAETVKARRIEIA